MDRALQTMRRVCVLLPRPGREKIRWPNRVKYPSGEECAATIRLSNAEINPLTALALDLQSSESPSLFHRFYVYPFDHDKFDFALSLSLSSSRSTTISSWHKPKKYVWITKERSQLAQPLILILGPVGDFSHVVSSGATGLWNVNHEPDGAEWLEREAKGLKREGTGQSIPSPDGWGIDSQVLSRPKSYDVYRRFHLVTTPPYFWKNWKRSRYLASHRRTTSLNPIEYLDPLSMQNILKLWNIWFI